VLAEIGWELHEGYWLRGELIDSVEDMVLAIKVRKARVFPRLKIGGFLAVPFLQAHHKRSLWAIS
jgi:hypothetical protein